MPETFTYDILKGSEVVGTIALNFKLNGDSASFPEHSIFKEKYYSKSKIIKIPIKQKVL